MLTLSAGMRQVLLQHTASSTSLPVKKSLPDSDLRHSSSDLYNRELATIRPTSLYGTTRSYALTRWISMDSGHVRQRRRRLADGGSVMCAVAERAAPKRCSGHRVEPRMRSELRNQRTLGCVCFRVVCKRARSSSAAFATEEINIQTDDRQRWAVVRPSATPEPVPCLPLRIASPPLVVGRSLFKVGHMPPPANYGLAATWCSYHRLLQPYQLMRRNRDGF